MLIKSFFNGLIAIHLLALGLLFQACSNESTFSPIASNGESDAVLSGETVSGISQKGPFIKGSTVTLYELDEQLHQTGIHYSTTIDNDEGKYHIDSVVLSKPYAWMIVKGNFINEITGKRSYTPITLNGLVKIEKNKDVNINILSHLAFNRIQYLVQQGLNVTQAQKQAEIEVLKAFNIEDDGTPFENMDIFANGEADAKLLAITLILLNQYEGDIPKTIDLLAQITYDLETDGVWNDTSLKNEVKYSSYSATYGTFNSARENMKYMKKTIPNFEKYINKFISPEHQGLVWGHCKNEGELQKNNAYRDSLHICHDSTWVEYTGFRSLSDPFVDTTGKFGTLVDSRDGHVYKTLTLKFDNGDSAIWMASSLEFNKTELEFNKTEYVYEDIYTKLCPDNWHITSKKEWNNMLELIQKNYQYGELLFDQGFDFYRGSEYYVSTTDEYISNNYPKGEVYQTSGTFNPNYVTSGTEKIRCIKDYPKPEKIPVDTAKYGKLIDNRDGNVYKTLDIEMSDGTTVTWMASLLEFEAPATTDSNTYYAPQHFPGYGRTYTYKQILNKPDDADTTELYPLLYAAENGEKIQGICPEKYHIPNYHEWDKLLEISQSNEQIKQLLIYPQQDFNKRTNTYAFYDERLVDNFNISGNHDREKEVVSPWRWTFTATMQPFTRASIIGKKLSYSSEYYYRPPHTLRCVKD